MEVKKKKKKSGEKDDQGFGSSRALARDEFISSVFRVDRPCGGVGVWEATARANGSSNKDETEPQLLSTHHYYHLLL